MPLSPPSSAIALYLASRRQQQGGKLPLHQHPFCPLGNSVQYIRNQQTDILPRTHSSKFKLIATILFPRTITISITSSSSAPKPPATATAVTVSTSRRLLISSSASFSAQQLQQQPAAIMGICARWTPKRLYVPVNAGLCHRSGDAAWWRGVATIQQMQARFLAMTYKRIPESSSGWVFSVLMLAIEYLGKRYGKIDASNDDEFSSASRTVQPGYIASGIVSA
ncbi:hypothetical protein A4X13_0g8233 [Tilletia indica]|uniref:Uncharacterized protein n=1 Tax=Tilletia indica TaxID=43049 RepID=A0A8T8SG87_9BASI|nr:hypothetical protein A4X13_0g8233 [Tilletia indica]